MVNSKDGRRPFLRIQSDLVGVTFDQGPGIGEQFVQVVSLVLCNSQLFEGNAKAGFLSLEGVHIDGNQEGIGFFEIGFPVIQHVV